MQVKVIRTLKHPFPHNLHQMVDLPSVDKLTPKTARIALAMAYENAQAGDVWDIENQYGYRVYGKSARKVKW